MSYCYDVMQGVFRRHITLLLVKDGKEDLALHFAMLIQDMHSANHEVPSEDGVFKGDGINKHPGVSRTARELDECAKRHEEGK